MFCVSLPVQAIPAHVAGQDCNNFINAGSQTSITCTMPGNITAGNFIRVCLNQGGTTTAPVWTSGVGDMFVVDLPVTSLDSGTYHLTCAYLYNAAGGVATVGASGTFLNVPVIWASEFSGVVGTIDQTSSLATGSSTAPASPSVTTVSNGELIIGIFSASGGLVADTGAGFTKGAAQGFTEMLEYKVQSTAGAISATATSSNGYWAAHVATFGLISITARHKIINIRHVPKNKSSAILLAAFK